MEELAPCVAVVGPANSGKTTLLHLLDRALQSHVDRPLVCVIKGNPDGTGRYQHESPSSRETLKPFVKGRWIELTAPAVLEWIENSRKRLDLVLVDLGGRHSPDKEVILPACTHYLVLSRSFADPSEEASDGLSSWVAACERKRLTAVAHLTSLWKEGEVTAEDREGVVVGALRADAGGVGDGTNGILIDALVAALLALARPIRRVDYVDLHRSRRWEVSDVATLAGARQSIEDRLRDGRQLILGGVAPIWAHCAAMHRALEQDAGAAVFQFDPKVPGAIVEIPPTVDGSSAQAWTKELAVAWSAHHAGWAVLHLLEIRADRFLEPASFALLPSVPLPIGEPPSGPIVTSGKSPIWLHQTYHRWLRSRYPERALGTYDVSLKGAILVHGHGAPRFEAGDFPRPPASMLEGR